MGYLSNPGLYLSSSFISYAADKTQIPQGLHCPFINNSTGCTRLFLLSRISVCPKILFDQSRGSQGCIIDFDSLWEDRIIVDMNY